MPGFDGTGPRGMGPMTGGGRGLCGPYGARYGGYGQTRLPGRVPVVGRAPFGFGRPRWGLRGGFWGRGRGLGLGMGIGLGRGRGRGRWW